MNNASGVFSNWYKKGAVAKGWESGKQHTKHAHGVEQMDGF